MKIETPLYYGQNRNSVILNNRQKYNTNYLQLEHKNVSPSFTGLSLKPLQKRASSKIKAIKAFFNRENEERLWDRSHHIAHRLDMETRKVHSLLEKEPYSRVSFLTDLSNVYNSRNFYRQEKEDTRIVFRIFDLVKKPEAIHRNIVNSSDMPFETLEELFKAAPEKDQIDFVQRMQHDVLGYSEKDANTIIHMLKSKHSKSYITQTENYISYLKLNNEDPDCISNLDKLIDKGIYDQSIYDKKMMYNKMMSSHSVQNALGDFKDIVEEKLTKSRAKFTRHLCHHFLSYRNNQLTHNEKMCIFDMYSTTNKNNLNLRLKLIDKFKYPEYEKQNENCDIESLHKLFNAIDKNEHVASFVEKSLDDRIDLESVEEFNKILAVIPPKKADIFHKNVVKIVKCTEREHRSEVLLSELENPYFPAKLADPSLKLYVNARKIAKPTKLQELSNYLENQYNIYRFKKIEKETETFLPIEAEKINIPAPSKDIASVKQIEEVSVKKAEVENIISTPKVEDVTAEVKTNKPKTKIFTKTLNKAPNAKKLKLQSDINEVISKKLGPKTYEDQIHDYKVKVTAMRIKMLPDIFESISATRKAQRAEGKRPNVANKDAFILYEKIQGRNKKLVRYMLKQTDENNNRIFNIKEIVDFIDKANAKIAQDKKLNPSYKAADARAYYESLYQDMLEQHGKLKKTRNSKKVKK